MHKIQTLALQKHFQLLRSLDFSFKPYFISSRYVFLPMCFFLLLIFFKNLQCQELNIFSSTSTCFLCYITFQAMHMNFSCIKPQRFICSVRLVISFKNHFVRSHKPRTKQHAWSRWGFVSWRNKRQTKLSQTEGDIP